MTIGHRPSIRGSVDGVGTLPCPLPSIVSVVTPVWAIDEERAPIYYLPRDCPRVTYWALPDSSPADLDRFLGCTTARMVIAIESGWLERVRATSLYVYHLPGDTFTLVDKGAGFYTSTRTVTPLKVRPVGDLLRRLIEAGVELRVTPSLWPLNRVVVASTLHYSAIRMRNAEPEPDNSRSPGTSLTRPSAPGAP